MPLEISFLDNGAGVLIVGTGMMSGQELLEAKTALFADQDRTRRYRYGLIDYAGVTDLEMTSRELELVAAKDRQAAVIAPGVCVAIIANKDVVYGLARMWEAYMHNAGWETHVFRSRESAEAWIRERVVKHFGVVPTLT